MNPTEQMRRRLQELTIRSIHLIEEGQKLIEPELRLGQSTYKLDRDKAKELEKCFEETLDCLRQLLVNI